MAQDITDPTVESGGGDWFAQNAPPAAGGATADQVTALYQQLLGRAPENDQVIQQWIAGTGGNLDAIKQGIAGTDEGKAYATRQAGAPSAVSGGGGDDAVRAQVAQWAAMPGADPSLAKDPEYWVRTINAKGGLTDANRQYWQDATVGPTAFFNNPNRESGVANPAAGFGAPPSPYASNPNAPTPPPVPTPPAALANPYAVQGTAPTAPTLTPFTTPPPTFTPYTLPTMADAENDPGYKFGETQGLNTINRSAAARGTVLNPGTVQALNRYGTDYATTKYNDLVSRGLAVNANNNGLLQTGFGDAVTANNAANNVTQTGFNDALGTFTTANQFGLAVRQQNQGEFQQNVVAPTQTAFQNQYASYLNDNARTLNDYLTNYNIGHTADTDYWNRLKDVSGAGLTAAINDKAAA